jgi:ABC-type dipeptide/oligopeptide/nickel transport system permease component
MPLLALSSIFGLTIATILVLWALHRVLHPDILFTSRSVAFVLITFPAFFGATAPALMLLNFVLGRIPPLRRIFEKNAEGVQGGSYQASMDGLWKVAKILVPPALILSLIGATEPWAF